MKAAVIKIDGKPIVVAEVLELEPSQVKNLKKEAERNLKELLEKKETLEKETAEGIEEAKILGAKALKGAKMALGLEEYEEDVL